MEKFSLKRTVQCAKCPWKVDTDPFDIPHGYSLDKHRALKCTIAGDSNLFARTGAMACHHSEEGNEQYCVGWLHNQLGVGNNIGLRIQMLRCENIKDLEIVGDQHRRFEHTLPETTV